MQLWWHLGFSVFFLFLNHSLFLCLYTWVLFFFLKVSQVFLGFIFFSLEFVCFLNGFLRFLGLDVFLLRVIINCRFSLVFVCFFLRFFLGFLWFCKFFLRVFLGLLGFMYLFFLGFLKDL